MAKLVLMRGYPGSGKSTIAMNLVHSGYVRVNRDDIRASMFGGEGVLSFEQENLITAMQRSVAKIALDAEQNVVVDDMNLRLKFAREWADFAILHGHQLEVCDVETHVDECLRRNEARRAAGGRYVPAEAIRDIAGRFPYPWPAITPKGTQSLAVEPVEYDDNLYSIVLCDIDGTVAHMHDRSPYDWSKVGNDLPDYNIIDLVDILRTQSYGAYQVKFFSGRDAVCREATLDWLNEHIGFVKDEDLFMRPEGDMRKDSIIKYELFNEHIRGKYNVKYVLDDRKQVVEMWRALGLTVLAVADGDF